MSIDTSKTGKRPDGKPGPAWFDPNFKPKNPLPAIAGWPTPFTNEKFWAKPLEERFRAATECWSKEGYGVATIVGSIYVIKMVLCWLVFYYYMLPTVTLENGELIHFGMEAIGKFGCFNVLVEGLGLSAMWGPLGGKHDKFTTAYLHFLTPGTIKLPSLPFLNPKANPLEFLISSTRNIVDCVLYAATMFVAAWLSFAPLPEFLDFANLGHARWSPMPLVILMILFGFLDRGVYVAVRADYYLPQLVVFAFCRPEHWLAGIQFCQITIWLGAALSKCGPWFPYVTGVMVCNGFFVRIQAIKDKMYDKTRDAIGFKNPDRSKAGGENKESKPSLDILPPSNFAHKLTHFGTFNEFFFPGMCLLGNELCKTIGLFIGISFHAYIIAMIPLGVPTEWNVMVVTLAYYAFQPGTNLTLPGLSALADVHPMVWKFMLFQCVFIPILGNLVPRYVGFLNGYRYYAGNWASQVYLIKHTAFKQLVSGKGTLKTFTTTTVPQAYHDQLTCGEACSLAHKTQAFRLMYWPGRAIPQMVKMAFRLNHSAEDVENPEKLRELWDDYVWVDGEGVASIVLGHGFGDGYLHDDKLMREIQKRETFAPGDILALSYDSPGILSPGHLPFEIYDMGTILKKGAERKGYFDLHTAKAYMSK